MVFTICPIDDRIGELCTKAAIAGESEIEDVFLELKAALREHTRSMKDTTRGAQIRSPKK
jgi:hypothetical protein